MCIRDSYKISQLSREESEKGVIACSAGNHAQGVALAAKMCIRDSHQTEQAATVYPAGEGRFRLEFDQPQRAPTPGQAVVLYQGDVVLGGGTIVAVE